MQVVQQEHQLSLVGQALEQSAQRHKRLLPQLIRIQIGEPVARQSLGPQA